MLEKNLVDSFQPVLSFQRKVQSCRRKFHRLVKFRVFNLENRLSYRLKESVIKAIEGRSGRL